MICENCSQEIEFDLTGSIEIRFNDPDLTVEDMVFCTMSCVKRWFN